MPVLKNVNFSVEEGEYVAIMGPSGSGKSTLMNIIGCLDKPTSGSFYLDGKDILKYKDNALSTVRLNTIGFVFQSFFLMMKQTALENVCLPLTYAGIPKRKRKEIAAQALKRVGLEDRMNYKPTQLSGGQCQRVAIARAISNHPKIFQSLHEEGVTIIMITHDSEIASHAQRVIHIRDGQIAEQ